MSEHIYISGVTPEEAAKLKGGNRPLTREEVAEREVGTTTVTPRVRWLFIGLFLFTILAVPVIQHVIEVREGKSRIFLPKAAEVASIPGQAWREFSDSLKPTAWGKFEASNDRFMRDAKAYEKALEDESFLAVAAIPPTQAVTSSLLGLGNEQVYIGRDGWLFYQPEVGYLADEGFMRKDFQRSRIRSGNVQPDPVKGIVNFRDQLAARGIRLVLMPAPVKPMIEPEHLSARYEPWTGTVLQNPSYDAFLKALDVAGVDYLDVSGPLAAAKKKSGLPQFLKTDTHWTPEAMELAAALLAGKLHALGTASAGGSGLSRTSVTIAGRGDIAAMLKLRTSSTLYPAQTVTIQPVSKADGSSWASDPAASVLVLGDSFTNIYSLEPMGWGKSAGFVEQLAFQLQTPVDSIQRNDAGAYATRELLARELAQGRDRLAGKKIVVWEFAMRELSVGDWKLVNLPAVTPRAPATVAPVAGGYYAPHDGVGPVRVTATVTAVAQFPRPGSVPYKDHIFCVSLANVSGPDIPAGSRAVVYLWSMQNNVLTPASGWKAGDAVTLNLKLWNDVAADHERFNRSELDDDALQLETPCWGEPIK